MVKKDFSPAERPVWILSCYGFTKEDPSIISGTDVSPEEARLLYLHAEVSGNLNEYVSSF